MGLHLLPLHRYVEKNIDMQVPPIRTYQPRYPQNVALLRRQVCLSRF
jgi:hypothetical protein